jgi:signal transduction histidine kinase
MAAVGPLIYVFFVNERLPRLWSRLAPIDVGIAALVAAAELVGTHLLTRGAPPERSLDWLGYGVLVATAAPLAARRVYPVATLVATIVFAFTYDALDYPAAFYTIAIVVALYGAVAQGRRAPALAIVAAAFAAFVITDVLFPRGHVMDPPNALWFGGWLVAGWVAGEFSRSRRSYLEEVERRAVDAERTRDEEARRRASEERMRIARELHDVLAHSMSVINVQASVALHLLDRQPEQARPALVAITQASRDALRDLRATLGVLRGTDEAETRSPAPTLARLDDLVRTASAAGVQVRVNVTGGPRPLPPGIDLAAYRIAQESLTNVARHAAASTATLSIAYGDDELLVEVADDGTEIADPGSVRAGLGLIGMRERAASVGGEVEAGPRPEGGFRVRVRLPLVGTT